MTKGKSPDPVALAIGFVRLHARRDPRFAKGPDKARIIEAREIVAAFDAARSVTGDAFPAAVGPAEPTALDAAIAELEAFDRDGTILEEIDDWAGFCECVLLCLGELKRLRAQGDVQAKLDQYRAAWKALSGPLSWMQHSEQLTAYAGWSLSEIANDLIDRAYPGLQSSAVAAMEARGHG